MIKKSDLEQIISQDLSELWNVLLPEQRRIVSQSFTIHRYKKSQIIYAEGEEPEFLWCLLKGKVKTFKSGIGERVQIIRLYRPVQYFGYRAYFADEKYVSTSATMEPSVVGSLPLPLVNDMIHKNNQLAMFFIRDLACNLGTSDSRIVSLTQKHIRGRLAEALTVLIDSYGYEEDGVTIRVYMAREDLANLSNMTTSNAIRTLSCFVAEHIVIVDGRCIKIINEPALRKISRFG